MSSQDIRLRLVVRRHAVPEVKLVWPCSASDELTIAKLLAQVNEVIPLESGDWGFEDYAVELADGKGGSFECLHFQHVDRILKDDDQVLIRSLLVEDLKRRRLSGRHQISTDGKHLVDGLAFGRPWLRTPRDRPDLRLPPRKRARITQDEEQDDDEPEDQLLLEAPSAPQSFGIQATFDDADVDSEDEEDDDDAEFAPQDESDDDESVIHHGVEESDEDDYEEFDKEELQSELELLRNDNNKSKRHQPAEPPTELLEFDHASDSENDSDNDEPAVLSLPFSMLDNILALRMAFPLTSVRTIETELKKKKNDMRRAYGALSKLNTPSISFDELMDRVLTGLIESNENGLLPEAGADIGHGKAKQPTRPLIQEVDDEAIPNIIRNVTSAMLKASRSTNKSDTSESEDVSTSDSSSADDDSSSSSEHAPLLVNTAPGINTVDPSDSDDDSSDSDFSDEGALLIEEVGSASDKDTTDSSEDGSSDEDSSDDNSSDSDSDGSSDESDSEAEPEETSSKPHSTVKQSSTQGPRSSKPASATKSQKIQEVSQTHGGIQSRTQKRNARRKRVKQQKLIGAGQPASSVSQENDDLIKELAARKKELLDAISGDTPTEETPNTKQKSIKEDTAAESSSKGAPVTEVSEASPAPADLTPQRRSRVDMGAGRRLLFGALGLKNPKSKADEDKIRQGLMKDVRPLNNSRLAEKETEEQTEVEDGDIDSWRHKITYRAVECCQEGIVLSEPPFPFVQRWDPQQQFDSMRKRKRNSNYNDESSFVDDTQWYDNGEEVAEQGSKKSKKKRKSKGGQKQTGVSDEVDVTLDYDDPPNKAQHDSSQITELDDLPALPSDCSTLPAVQPDSIKTGMVMTWKQLVLSKTTNWQPQVVSVTGLVLAGGDETTVHVMLAKRDRDRDDKVYDEHTGQRVYDKFEAPDSDEDDGEDDGYRTLPWDEIIEPRLVQQAPPLSESENVADNDATMNQDGKELLDAPGDIEVSKTLEHKRPLIQEVADSQEASASLESDLQGHWGAQGSHVGSHGSPSIQSGQGHPFLSLSGHGEDLTTSATSPGATVQMDRDTSGEDPAGLPAGDVSQLAGTLGESIQDYRGTAADRRAELGFVAADVPVADAVDPAPIFAFTPDSEPALLEPLHPLGMPPLEFADGGDDIDLPASVEYPQLTIPASLDSVDSGRQPQPEDGMGDSLNQMVDDDSMIPDSVALAEEITATPNNTTAKKDVVASSSPFPTLDEIFHSAKQTQERRHSGLASLKPKVWRDMGYEDAMRQLDEGEGEGSESSSQKMAWKRNLFPNATQPTPFADASASPPVITPKASKVGKLKSKGPATPFVIPEGSQIITLSSSPSPSAAEDDELNGTYEEDSGKLARRGSGDKRKQTSSAKRETRSRTRQSSTTGSRRITRSETRSQPGTGKGQ